MEIEVFQTIESRDLAHKSYQKADTDSIIHKTVCENLDTILKIDLEKFAFTTMEKSDEPIRLHKIHKLNFNTTNGGKFCVLRVFVSTKVISGGIDSIAR